MMDVRYEVMRGQLTAKIERQLKISFVSTQFHDALLRANRHVLTEFDIRMTDLANQVPAKIPS
jgi:hypothetical protein